MKMLDRFNKKGGDNWLKDLVRTDRRDLAPLILRTTLGAVIFAHGAQKLFGWFGGPGYDATMNYFTTSAGLPWIVAFLLIVVETVGALCLILGFGTRIMALGIAAIMVGAISMVHWNNGFFMDWGDTINGEGFEFHLLALAMTAALMAKGGGKWSVDAMFRSHDQDNRYFIDHEGSLNTANDIGMAFRYRKEKKIIVK